VKRILIIEDEESIAELEKDYLQINGYEAEIELNGEAGLRRAMSETFDLVILDLMLPKIDGFEVCKRIRSERDIPILMVSAKKEDIDKIRGLGLGADDYITKPFSPSELVARVKSHLSRYDRLVGNNSQNKEVIKIRGLTVDKGSRRVFMHEKEINFTTKEFDILTYLALNPNRVFTREELFEKIWGLDSAGDIATVTVHIRKLREKLEQDPSNPQYIETIWGVGYRFRM
jgi:DNA-binding response OmpR family regulator